MLPETITPAAPFAPERLKTRAVIGPLASTLAEELQKLRETMQALKQEEPAAKSIESRKLDEMRVRISDLENAIAAVRHEK